MKKTELGKLRVGDKFYYEENTDDIVYIALALTPDPFGVYVLDHDNNRIEKHEEDALVVYIKEYRKRGKKLEVLD